MEKPSNHQTSSEISHKMRTFKRQLAHIWCIPFQKSWILVNLISSMKTEHFQAPSSGHQNEPFQCISCKISKEGLPSFIVPHCKSSKHLICSPIIYRSLYLSEKCYFHETTCLIFKRDASKGKLTFLQAKTVPFIVSP